MNTLSFCVGKDRYAVPARQVTEIVPWVTLRKIPHAPAYVAGLLNYRGTAVPVIDLTALMTGSPSKRVLNTRIMLVEYPGKNDETHVLGILAERIGVSDDQARQRFVDTGIQVAEAPYLGAVSVDEREMIQVIRIEALLPEPLRESLFSAQETSVS